MTSVLADSIPGIRVVKAFAQEQREIDRFHRSNDRVLSAADRVNRTWAFFGPVVQVLNEFGLLVIWVFAVWQICRGGDVKLHRRHPVGVRAAMPAASTAGWKP